LRKNPYFCAVKRILLKIGAFLMALHILFVSMDVNVNFHYCLEDHHVNTSFGDASRFCVHCLGHHHHEHHQGVEDGSEVLHFGEKCCCEDFDSEICFADGFTFSTDKLLILSLPRLVVADVCRMVVDEEIRIVLHCFVREKIPYLFTGRLRSIFFSNMKLNPLV